jgi:hypothetical protein
MESSFDLGLHEKEDACLGLKFRKPYPNLRPCWSVAAGSDLNGINGSKIDVGLNASAVRGENGQVLFSRSILHDITKQKCNKDGSFDSYFAFGRRPPGQGARSG